MTKQPGTLLLFYILVAYIILQFVWWTYLLSNLTGEVFMHKQAELKARITDPAQLEQEIALVKKKQHSRVTMIVGEGSVFLLLLALGIFRVKKSFEKEAELASRQRNFMLSVTHELKTPLAAIKLNLQTLKKHRLDEQTKENVLNNALQESERLNQLLENVLMAARMESAAVSFMSEKVNLSELLSGLVTVTFNSSRIKKEIEEDVFVQSDKIALISLLSNIIENALKYSGEEVVVRLFRSEGKVIAEVADLGPGIPESERKNVFEKFYRIGNEETRKTKGTGLGLFIVHYIAGKTGVDVKIIDNKPRGSVFRLVFSGG